MSRGKQTIHVSVDDLRTRLRYDPLTGDLTVAPGHEKIAKVMRGELSIRVRLYNRTYPADSIVLYHATGQWPGPVVWHYDQNPFNLRLANLSPLRTAFARKDTPK